MTVPHSTSSNNKEMPPAVDAKDSHHISSKANACIQDKGTEMETLDTDQLKSPDILSDASPPEGNFIFQQKEVEKKENKKEKRQIIYQSSEICEEIVSSSTPSKKTKSSSSTMKVQNDIASKSPINKTKMTYHFSPKVSKKSV